MIYRYIVLMCGVSVKSMAVVESDKHLRLLIASSDGYIKMYDVCIEVSNWQKLRIFLLSL